MKIKMSWLVVVVLLVCTPVSAVSQARAGFILSLDAGMPLKGAEGRYGADFGRLFLDLAAQARLGGNFCIEGMIAFYPGPRPGDVYQYNSDGFELALDGVWKIAAGKRIVPFVKLGLSYAWITSNNAYMEIYYPDAGRLTDRWLGVNAGGGVEYPLGRKLLLRVGGTFTLVPNDGEGAIAFWGKLFAGLGFRF